MVIWTRKAVLADAITDWQSRGLITASTAATLSADTQANVTRFAFRNILILLAVICLGFAAMTFVAANWEDMTRLTRVGLIFAAMWGFWCGSVLLNLRNHRWFAQVFTLGACAMFGAGIMLISQIYHIQGSPKDATWLWAIGTMIAAALTRSIPALCLTIALLLVWLFLSPSLYSRTHFVQLDFPLYMIACAGLAYWMRSRFAAHLITLTTYIWAGCTAISFANDQSLTLLAITFATAFIVLSAALFSDRKLALLGGFERAFILYTTGYLAVMIFAWHDLVRYEWRMADYPVIVTAFVVPALISVAICTALAVLASRKTHPNTYDLVVTPLFATLTFGTSLLASNLPVATESLMLIGSIWLIRMGWRLENRPIAVGGFVAFGNAMLVIYFETVGTLLGTSMFYLAAGVLLLAGVFVVPRMTRMKGARQ
ncbi:DUF2157 domain-containing protein [Roseobacter sp. N2S]|uniref:DUF2157 domain-containing protein n=1 Tax=Roseobacter sp. N2S TaxID=2663844 RepID=UPI00285F223C|nr:DUF2157 domain-containing protein [Roseobacter sp. N2S]MDR6263733.1 putative membrane protein [Roseobacter sp. N2S]